MKYEYKPEEFTQEKSLLDIYLSARRIKFSSFNRNFTIVILVLMLVHSFVLSTDISKLAYDVRKWSEMGFAVGLTVLGFLVAGFTIFITLTKPDMQLALMGVLHKNTGLPHLKYNYFCLIRVFIYYVAILVAYLCVILLGGEGGLLSKIISFLPYDKCIKITFVKFAYGGVGASLIFLILQLKSFIFNLYSITMNSLRWEDFKIKNDITNP